MASVSSEELAGCGIFSLSHTIFKWTDISDCRMKQNFSNELLPNQRNVLHFKN